MEKQTQVPAVDPFIMMLLKKRYGVRLEKMLAALQGAANGKYAAEIGKELFVSDRTVEAWYCELMRLMECKTKTQLIAEALRKKLIN
ncbi:MAG: response regulator transcription factor [Chitinophagaceae bacterium]|nr:MAG: response regulator transcription factor [Chitinophagaceae bacterium]